MDCRDAVRISLMPYTASLMFYEATNILSVIIFIFHNTLYRHDAGKTSVLFLPCSFAAKAE